MLRRRESYKQIGNQLIGWLMDHNGEGYRPDFLRFSGVKPNSLTDVQRRLKETGLIEIEPDGRVYLYRLTSKGYEYGKALEAQLIGERYGLPDYVSEYLEKARSKRVVQLWPLQENYVKTSFGKDEELFVCGPPASGKTLIAEIEMLREIKENSGKALYCTPFKALDRQKAKDFSNSFGKFGYKVETTDGDHPSTPRTLKEAKIIVATYERVLMALKNEEEWLKDLTLVCADEITILDEENRGSNIDIVLTLLKQKYGVRVVTLSSLIGNPRQIADWLHAKLITERKALAIKEYVVYRKDGEVVFLSADGSDIKERLKDEEDILTHILSQNLDKGETTLIFFPSRQNTELFARVLSEIHAKHLSQQDRSVLEAESDEIIRSTEEETPLLQKLASVLKFGVAFHHAGLPFEARKRIEDLLEKRHLKTVCATTTLSHGIDYPVDNVIIAFFYTESKSWEFERYSYVQLKGRSGRPDKSKGPGQVFLLARNEEEGRVLWNRYLFNVSLESITSDTLKKENIAKLVLLEAKKDSGTNVKEITSILIETLEVSNKSLDSKTVSVIVRKVLSDLRKFKLIEGRRKIRNTELGDAVNSLTQSPYDAQFVIRFIEGKKKISDFLMLFIACSIGIAKDVRTFNMTVKEMRSLPSITRRLGISLSGASPNASLRRALILAEYIQEEKVGNITDRYAYFDDNDVYELSKYASRSMSEVARIAKKIGRLDIAKRAELLAQRIRYGVKEDLIKSKLVFLPEVGRVRGRRLFNAGFRSIEAVAKALRLAIIDAARVGAETAIKIQDAAKRDMKQSRLR
ncbi:hypothetical protein DRO69_00915 [Candidatus Bathyarchaeota archaeon]|nr:MAG: hypothetical protein DRO69_00915 [Candidatus Bathyarchaeota archaeon]